jgi:hypothetical protein
MRLGRQFAVIVVVLALVTSAVASKRKFRFSSRDGALVAEFISYNESEGSVEIKDKSGKSIAMRDFRSTNGRPGYDIGQVMWTPDSQFLVIHIFGAGGHHSVEDSPLLYFSRKDQRFHVVIDDSGNPVSDDVMQFKVEAPAQLTVALLSSKKLVKASLSDMKASPAESIPGKGKD